MSTRGSARLGRGFIRFERRQGIFERMRRPGVNAMGRVGLRRLRLRTGAPSSPRPAPRRPGSRRPWRRPRAGGHEANRREAGRRSCPGLRAARHPARRRRMKARPPARGEAPGFAPVAPAPATGRPRATRRRCALLFWAARHPSRADAQATPSGVAPRTSVKDLWLTSAYRGVTPCRAPRGKGREFPPPPGACPFPAGATRRSCA